MYLPNKSRFSSLLLITLLAFAGCVSSGGDSTPVVDDSNTTSPDPIVVVVGPTADAGRDQNVVTSSTVVLDGSDSDVTTGLDLTYDWAFTSKPTGSSATLTDATTVSPRFTADTDGRYEIRLTISQDSESDTDTVIIVATTGNAVPVANAGPDQNVQTNTLVTLDGSRSSDANGDNLTFRWSLTSMVEGSSALLSNSTGARPTFTADGDGTYVIQLIVNDGTVDSDADQVTITASTANSAPIADAGPDQNVQTDTLVTLDGSGSSDANGDELTYQWSVVSVPYSVSLSSTTSAKPTFSADSAGTYVFSLTVNDAKANSPADNVSITATETNSAPVMISLDYVYQAHLPFLTGDDIYLQAVASDANSDSLTYTWTITVKPSTSQARILDSHGNTDLATFTPDVPGDYVITVKANDGLTDSTNTKSRTFTVTSRGNTPPVADAGEDIVLDDAGDNIMLFGSGYDADGDELTYKWTLLEAPEGVPLYIYSDAPPPGTAMLNTSEMGVYKVQLIVNDGIVDSAPDTMTVTATQNWRP